MFPAELIDLNGEFDLGNQFTLSTATYLSESLDDQFRVIVKYQGTDFPTYNDHKHNIVFCTSKEIHVAPEEFFRDDILIIIARKQPKTKTIVLKVKAFIFLSLIE